jgi:HK97 family phage prohead protease
MKRLNEKQWRDEKELRDAVLLKAVDTVITEGDEERVLNFRISTETPDSYNDVIKADGWDLERFEKNPVVLWAHDHRQPPVGQALSIGVDGDALVAEAKFADAETYAFADTVYRLLKKGFLRATSVGFFPKEWTYDEDRGGYNFIANELFEFSIVPVPANPDALALAVKDGIDCAPLKEWAEKTLDMWTPDDSVALWVPRAQIEELHKSLTDGSTIVTIEDKEKEFKEKVVQPILTKAEIKAEAEALAEAEKAEKEAEAGDNMTVKKTTKIGDIVATVEVTGIPEVVRTFEALDDEIESLKAQVDQLQAKVAAGEKAEGEEEGVEVEGELAAVIDIQIDSHAVEDEVDLAILDLDINPEQLQQIIRDQLENEFMKTTGKLPKEV